MGRTAIDFVAGDLTEYHQMSMSARHRKFSVVAILLAAAMAGPSAVLAEESAPAEKDKSAAAKEKPPAPWKPPVPKAVGERVVDRHRMVDRQIAKPRDFRQKVKNDAVLQAMRTVPRHMFVPANRRRAAYRDSPLPIGHAQTISQPYIVALMTELLELTPESKVLEIGTGSGYQAAVLGQLTPHVYSMEIIEPLSKRAGKALKQQGYDKVEVRNGDGYWGWKDKGPFDAIIVTCAAGHLPPPLWEQLKPGGRIVVPIGGRYDSQRLVLITKSKEGKRQSKSVLGVRFVPMTGRVESKK